MPTGAGAVRRGAGATSRVALASVAGGTAALSRVGDAATALSRIVESGSLWVYAVPTATGQKVVLMFSTILKLGVGATVFLGGGGISTDEDAVVVAMPAGTVVEVAVTSSEEPGAGTYTATLRKEKADTAVVVALTGAGDANRKGKSTVSVPYSSLEWLSLRLESTGGAPATYITVAIKYQFAT